MTNWTEIVAARRRAHEKHGANSIEAVPAGDPRWLPILVEEVGEVAHALTYDADPAALRGELVDVLAVASAWLDALDGSDLDALPVLPVPGDDGSDDPSIEGVLGLLDDAVDLLDGAAETLFAFERAKAFPGPLHVERIRKAWAHAMRARHGLRKVAGG